MGKSYNKSGSLALFAFISGAILYAAIFLGNEKEHNNGDESNPLTTSNISTRKITTNSNYNENRSDFTGVKLPTPHKRSSLSSNYAFQSEIAFPNSDVSPTNLQIQSSGMSGSGYSGKPQITRSLFVGTTSAQKYINASFLFIQNNNAQDGSSALQGSKRSIPLALAGGSSSSMNGKQSSRNGAPPSGPGEPGEPVSLPIGDGTWLMLMLAGIYSLMSLKVKQVHLKTKEIN